MTHPWRNDLTRRILLLIGAATALPLTLLVGAVLFQAYRFTSDQIYSTLEQTSRRYAANFEARLHEKRALMGAIASVVGVSGSLDDPSRFLVLDPDLRRIWVRREGQAAAGESEAQRFLYEEVRQQGVEVLSAPDWAANEASLAFPLREGGRFAGVVAVTFSLEYFQKVVTEIHLFRTGYALLVSHQGYRIAHPDRRLIGVQIGNDVAPETGREMLAHVDAGLPFSFEKRALLTGKWSHQYYSPVTVGQTRDPWFLAVVVPAEEAETPLNDLFLMLIAGTLMTLLVVVTVTVGATRKVVTTLALQEEALQNKTVSLEASLVDLELAQKKIVESEKLAVLGQLTATIAHEINTPLGAIRSSATHLNQGVLARVGALPEQFRRLGADEVELYRRLVVDKGVDLAAVQGSDERRRRRALAQTLLEWGVHDPEGVADDIVFLVPPDQEGELLAAVSSGKVEVVRMAAEAASMVQSGAIILQSADRAASTVTALVEYARVGDVQAAAVVDPGHELDVILTLYYGLSRKGVDVVREFEPGVVLWGDRDRLNQVWVNLINNALQAMEYHGHLRLRVRTGPRGPEVSVANDGPRIPPDLHETIFQPFFTTKKAGEGTGLGLDVCRRIVSAHGGQLTVSEEGPFTVFTASLPPPPPRSPS